MSKSSLPNQHYEFSNDDLSRKLSLFRELDKDRHYEFINHVSIGISVAISVVVLLGLYVIASMLIDYGSAIHELKNLNNHYSSKAGDLMLYALITFICVVLIISAFCLRFLIKLRKALIACVEEAYEFRKDQLGKK